MTARQALAPVPTALSRPFWEGCARGELLLQRCERCGRYRYPPAARCPSCRDARVGWARASGRGLVWSVAVIHQVYHPDLEAQVPYAVAVVELEEGVRMVSNVVGVVPGAIEVGMPVEVVFEEAWGVTIPRFQPRGGA